MKKINSFDKTVPIDIKIPFIWQNNTNVISKYHSFIWQNNTNVISKGYNEINLRLSSDKIMFLNHQKVPMIASAY